jgi:hypothetical protein
MQSSGPTSSKHVRRRKVADLNEEQKQRKRNMDRQAQQAFRERTKAQIQELEEEVETLRYQASENEEIWRHENARLRKQVQRLSQRLRQIRDLASSQTEPMLDLTHDRAPPKAAHQQMEPVATANSPVSILETAPGSAADESQVSEHVASNAAATEGSQRYNDDNHQVSHFPAAGQQPASSPSLVNPTNPLISGVDFQSSNSQTAAAQRNQDIELPDHTMHLEATYETVCAASILPGFLPPTSLSAQSLAPHVTASTIKRRREIYETTCDHSHRTCPFDHILVNHLESKRLDIARGESLTNAIGPLQPDMAGIFQPERAARSHPLSRMLVEMMLTFAHVNRVERVAFMYKIHKTMRVSAFPIGREGIFLIRTVAHCAEQGNI